MNDLLLLAQDNAGGLWFGGLFFIWVILAIIGLALWVWALVSAIQNPALDSTMRIVWVLVIVFTGFIGAIIYLLMGRGRHSSAL